MMMTELRAHGERVIGLRSARGQLARGSRDGNILVGCLVVLGIIVLLLVIGGIIVAMNWRSWAASGFRSVSDQVIAQAELPAEEKDEVKVVMNGLIDDFESGDLTLEEVGAIFEELESSPLLSAGGVLAFNSMYVRPSDLEEEQKADISLQMSRVGRGIYEGSIPDSQLDTILAPLHAAGNESTTFEFNGTELKGPEHATSEELILVGENAKAAADEAGVPETTWEVDISAELEKVIARARGEAVPDDEVEFGGDDNEEIPAETDEP